MGFLSVRKGIVRHKAGGRALDKVGDVDEEVRDGLQIKAMDNRGFKD